MASEIPANEKAFAIALAQATQFRSDLIIFHVSDTLGTGASECSGVRRRDSAAARAAKDRFQSLAERARNLGIHCRVTVRQGLAAEQILTFLREREIDRVVMGTHSPGPVGRLLVGSVAEAVLRIANAPVCIVGPNVVEGTYRHSATRTILCDVSAQGGRRAVASFGAELAARHNASLILQHVIRPQERNEILADRTTEQIEAELPLLVPAGLKHNVSVRTKVTIGDPTEELLYGGRSQQANLIVLGAQGTSHFAAITHASIVHKVLAYAHCPVITLSPVVLAECGASEEHSSPSEVNYIAGVI